MEQDERTFEQAVRLAVAFVANGDIRLGTDKKARTRALEMLGDLIPELFEKIESARSVLALPEEDL
jgi:hypothetical protein